MSDLHIFGTGIAVATELPKTQRHPRSNVDSLVTIQAFVSIWYESICCMTCDSTKMMREDQALMRHVGLYIEIGESYQEGHLQWSERVHQNVFLIAILRS